MLLYGHEQQQETGHSTTGFIQIILSYFGVGVNCPVKGC
jgi:hypothetical protein